VLCHVALAVPSSRCLAYPVPLDAGPLDQSSASDLVLITRWLEWWGGALLSRRRKHGVGCAPAALLGSQQYCY